MVDVHGRDARSRNMAAIRGANTGPERRLRQELFAVGLRYRLHDRKLPGRPDLVLKKFGAVIFVHGCFFHGHECEAFRWPETRAAFWRDKIEVNRERDATTIRKLRRQGWRVLVVWECSIRGKTRLPAGKVAARVAAWLRSGRNTGLITGRRA